LHDDFISGLNSVSLSYRNVLLRAGCAKRGDDCEVTGRE
jgi:hypothetical protein